MSFLIQKIINYFKPLVRKEVIRSKLDPFLHNIIYKYDYFMNDRLNILSKKDDMTAMTTLPSGANLIAYAHGELKIWNSDKVYPCRKDIRQMIAISNEEIIIITTNGSFIERLNFVTNTLINRYDGFNHDLVNKIALVQDNKIISVDIDLIRVWDYDGNLLSAFDAHGCYSLTLINDKVFCRTMSEKIIIYDALADGIKIIEQRPKYLIIEGDDVYTLPLWDVIDNNMIHESIEDKHSLYAVHITQLSDQKKAYIFNNGAIKLFNFKTKEFDSEIEERLTTVVLTQALPDNKLIFINNDSTIRVCDFDTRKCTIIGKINKTLSDAEMRIKLELLSQK